MLSIQTGVQRMLFGLSHLCFFSSRRRHTSWTGDWSSDVCSSDLYAVLKADAMPEIVVRLIETVDQEGPFGAKGLGESGVIPVAAAVANAIKNAIGIRFTELPITPARVRAALAAHGDRKSTRLNSR